MNALCIFVAGALHATLPTTSVTVGWVHSIEKTRWEERYRVDGTKLELVQARVRGSGAGMEPGPNARLVDGWWTWQPHQRIDALRLTLSPYAGDYDLCWRERCHTLRSLAGLAGPRERDTAGNEAPDEVAIVELHACNGKKHE